MSVQRVTSSEPLPKIPSDFSDPAEVEKYIRDMNNYLLRLVTRGLTDDNISGSALPEGSACDILYHDGEKWVVLSPPASDGTYVLELTVDASAGCSLTWAVSA